MTRDELALLYGLNVQAPFLLVAALAPAMAARGRGSVFNVLSMAARFGMPGFALYGSSKAALLSLTTHGRPEYGPSGVRVNAASPGFTRTEGTVRFGRELYNHAGLAPAGRPGEAQEIASAIAYLAGNEASFVHGAVLDVDGGGAATRQRRHSGARKE